jgi:hypothetical protein
MASKETKTGMSARKATFEEKFPAFVEMEKDVNADDFTRQAIAEWRQLHEKHPFLPLLRPIPVLNLLMKREYAEQIVRGEKKMEWRSYSKHYHERLIDVEVEDYLNTHRDDELLQKLLPIPIRPVDRIHFHNFQNSWTLDVEVLDNNIVTLNKEGIKILHDNYGCYECDEEYEECRRLVGKFYPSYFFFVMGDIVERFGI